MFAVAAELLRRDGADECVTDAAIALTSVASNDKNYGM
jgi:hypothetical protein